MTAVPKVVFAWLAVAAFSSAARAGDDEMVANPFYGFWAGFKPGSAAVEAETLSLEGNEKLPAPDGKDRKVISYRLLEVTPDKVVVETVVTESDFLRSVQAAPTRTIFPAKVKKSELEAAKAFAGLARGEGMFEFQGRRLKCRTLTGAIKGDNDAENIDVILWICDEVPGGIVKQIRTKREGGKVTETSTVELQSFKRAE